MNSPRTPRQIVDQLNACVKAGDFDGVTELISSDFVVVEPPSLPYGGEYIGPAGFLQLLNNLVETWDMDFEPLDFFDAGDAAIVRNQFTGTHRRTGKAFSFPNVEIYRIRDGQICGMDIHYWDTAAAAEAARAD